MNRDLWELVKAFVGGALAESDAYAIYSEELKARFGLNNNFFPEMQNFMKEDRVEFNCDSHNYKPDMPSMGFDIVFKKIRHQE